MAYLNHRLFATKKFLALGLMAGMLCGQAVPSWAAGSDAFEFFQEEAKVVTANFIAYVTD